MAANPAIALVVAAVTWSLTVAGELLLQKRRDDVLARIAREGERKIALIHALTVYEAIRSRQLASEGIVKLLRSPEGRGDAGGGNR
jgi:hypothetical protein